MRTTTLGCRVVLGGLLMSAVGSASADDHGFYMGVDGGWSKYPSGTPIVLTHTPFKRDDVADTDFAWSFAAGYRFNRYFAIEAGFSDLGNYTEKLIDDPDLDIPSRGKIEAAAKGKTLSLLAHAPFGNWDPYFKLGVMYSIVDVRVEAKRGDEGIAFAEQSRDARLLAGIGARYAFTDRWAMSFAIDYYARLGHHTALGDTNVASPRVGFAYRF